MPAWITYSLARLGVFLVAFVVFYLLLGSDLWWAAALAAAVVGLAISTIFFGGLRARVAEQIADSRRPRTRAERDAERGDDELVEDGYVDESAKRDENTER